jgi:RNA polymerase sigma-70 factor (ECF subfamily)
MTAPTALLHAARSGDPSAFAELVAPYRGELQAHCYRMLGSLHDAEDAVQESLARAWRSVGRLDERGFVRAWLYTIATNRCLTAIDQRSRRELPVDVTPGTPATEISWLEPYPGISPETQYLARESVELAFVAALQHLSAIQRAVLILREVLQFSAAEVAAMLETSVPSVTSALQRARATVGSRRGQQEELAGVDERALVDEFVAAWERADVPALVSLLTADARFVMPPLPAWFDGPQWIERFWRERMFATSWRLRPIRANGQLAFACYQAPAYALSSILVLTVRDGRVAELTAFLDPAVLRKVPAVPMSS